MRESGKIMADSQNKITSPFPAVERAKGRLSRKSGESDEALARREVRVAAYQEKKKNARNEYLRNWLDNAKEPKWGDTIELPDDSKGGKQHIGFDVYSDGNAKRGGAKYLVYKESESAGGRIDNTRQWFGLGEKEKAIAAQKALYEKELEKIRKQLNK